MAGPRHARVREGRGQAESRGRQISCKQKVIDSQMKTARDVVNLAVTH